MWCGGDHYPAQCQYQVNKNVARARQAQVEANDGKPAEATLYRERQRGGQRGHHGQTRGSQRADKGPLQGPASVEKSGGGSREASAALARE